VGLVDQVRVARPSGRGRPRKRLAHLTGDKAHSSRANRAALRARRIPHTIPERDDQKANRARRGGGGRPPAFDRERYRQRNQVERLMNRRKQFRAVATRFDKLADRYQATITIADIFIWLRARPDQPAAIRETCPSGERRLLLPVRVAQMDPGLIKTRRASTRPPTMDDG
jgi:transposase